METYNDAPIFRQIKVLVFMAQGTNTLKNGVAFHQKSFGTIRCGLATSHNVEPILVNTEQLH